MSAEAMAPGHAAPHGHDPHRPAPARGWTLGIVCATTFMLLLDVTVVNVGLPSIRTSLGAGFAESQWVVAAYTLTMAAFLLTSGSLADRSGRRRVFTLGLAVFTASSLLAGLALWPIMLILARAVQGFGAAMLFAVGLALIGQEYHGAEERGKAFGVWGAVGGLAFACGPLVGGYLTNDLSWRWVFLVNVPIGLLALLATRRLRESRHTHPHPVDWAGMTTLGLGLALLLFAIMAGNAIGWDCVEIIVGFILGAVSLAAFVLIQRSKGPAAMLDLSLFKIPSFNGVAWGTFLCNAAALGAVFLLISYVQDVLGHSAWETGLRFVPLTLTLFVVALLTGRLGARVSPGLLLGTAISLIAVGLALVTLVEPGSDWTALLPSLLVTGAGMGMFNPPRAAVTIGVVGPARAGMASGMGQTFQQVGVALGVSVLGAMFQRCVETAFTDSAAAAQLGARAEEVSESIARNGTTELADLVPAQMLDSVTLAARQAYVGGLTEVTRIAAVLALAGAVVVFSLIRDRDLHESARGAGRS